MDKGVSNFNIDTFLKEEEDEDLQKNYMGTYSLDSITRYINFYEILQRINAKHLFAIFKLNMRANPEFTGGALWIFTKK